VQERDSNNAVRVTYTRGLDLSGSFAAAGGIGGLLARTDTNGSAFYHSDGAGNVTGLIDGWQRMVARYEYGPFGRVTAQWGAMAAANAMQFSSMPRHGNSGLSLYSFRGYDPTLQRWISPDPLGALSDANPYRLSYNGPLSYIDPDGLAPQLIGLLIDPSSGTASTRYADQQFGQGYGIGLNGPIDKGPIGAGMDLLNRILKPVDDLAQSMRNSGSPVNRGIGAMLQLGEMGLLPLGKLKCLPKGPFKYHYTTAPESSFKGELWAGSSVTDKLYTDPLRASQELGIPVPNKVIPILDDGHFVPNTPPIVQPSFRFTGGGSDFINPNPVPANNILPAVPLSGPRQ
jgi:RHS repeat-associated protein